jgi:hypothetical protein
VKVQKLERLVALLPMDSVSSVTRELKKEER